jgi:hypothetical protein
MRNVTVGSRRGLTAVWPVAWRVGSLQGVDPSVSWIVLYVIGPSVCCLKAYRKREGIPLDEGTKMPS